MSQKTYKVRNHKKIEHFYTLTDNVGEYLDLMASHEGRTMFVWKEKGERHEITYGEFADTVKRLSMGLRQVAGGQVTVGEDGERVRIAVIGETSPRWFASYLAVMAAGCTVVPMDKELALSEISGFMAFAGISAVVYAPSFNESMEEIAAGHPTLRLLIPMTAPETEAAEGIRRISFDELAEMGRESAAEFTADTDTERVAARTKMKRSTSNHCCGIRSCVTPLTRNAANTPSE